MSASSLVSTSSAMSEELLLPEQSADMLEVDADVATRSNGRSELLRPLNHKRNTLHLNFPRNLHRHHPVQVQTCRLHHRTKVMRTLVQHGRLKLAETAKSLAVECRTPPQPKQLPRSTLLERAGLLSSLTCTLTSTHHLCPSLVSHK